MVAELSLLREFLLLVPSCAVDERLNMSIPCAVHISRAQGHMFPGYNLWIRYKGKQRLIFCVTRHKGTREHGTRAHATRPHPMDTGPNKAVKEVDVPYSSTPSGKS